MTHSFTKEMDIKLIKFVEQNRSIYITTYRKSDTYENILFRNDHINELWRQFGKTIGKSSTECARRWRSIKAQYAFATRVKCYKYDHLLHFLDDVVKVQKRSNNVRSRIQYNSAQDEARVSKIVEVEIPVPIDNNQAVVKMESQSENVLINPTAFDDTLDDPLGTEPILVLESSDEEVINDSSKYCNDDDVETDFGYPITMIKEESTEFTEDCSSPLVTPEVEQPKTSEFSDSDLEAAATTYPRKSPESKKVKGVNGKGRQDKISDEIVFLFSESSDTDVEAAATTYPRKSPNRKKAKGVNGKGRQDKMSDEIVFLFSESSDSDVEAVATTYPLKSSISKKAKGVNGKARQDNISDDWMLELSDDDMDIDVNDDPDLDCAIPLPAIELRDATCEPATEANLTQLQVDVLRASDKADDEALRRIAPLDALEFTWSKNPEVFKGTRENFEGICGPTFSSEVFDIIEIFYKIFDYDIIDLLVEQTNLYATQTIQKLKTANKLQTHRPQSRLNCWVHTDRDEMFTFLAFMILQGLYPVMKEEGYFGFNGWGTMPLFSKIISYNRYLLLKTFLHFVDNKKIQGTTDRLCKIQPVIDHFNEKFSSLYRPSQNIVIDESVLKMNGELNITKKIASKTKTGIKIYELCDSLTGYLWRFSVTAGKKKGSEREDGPTVDSANDVPDQTTAPLDRSSAYRPDNSIGNIAYDLVQPLLDLGHTLIMNSFYNSPLLARCLKRRRTDSYGTLRLNRQYVADSLRVLQKGDLRQGESVISYCPDLAIMVWRDANLISIISTYHDLQIETQDKHDCRTNKSNVLLEYNKSMGGLVKRDQFLSSQPLEKSRSRSWSKKMFRRLLNVAVFNAWIIFSTKKSMKHRCFREILANDLLKRHRRLNLANEARLLTQGQQRTSVSKEKAKPDRPVIEENHFPIKTGSVQTLCWICSQAGRITRTIWKCEECNVNLCLEICFKAYHK